MRSIQSVTALGHEFHRYLPRSKGQSGSRGGRTQVTQTPSTTRLLLSKTMVEVRVFYTRGKHAIAHVEIKRKQD